MGATCPECFRQLTDQDDLYCPYCNCYLGGRGSEARRAATIWETDARNGRGIRTGAGKRPSASAPERAEESYILCRACGRKTPVRNPARLPLACEACGEAFDRLLDVPRRAAPAQREPAGGQGNPRTAGGTGNPRTAGGQGNMQPAGGTGNPWTAGGTGGAEVPVTGNPQPGRQAGSGGPLGRKAVRDTSVLRLRSLNTPEEIFPSPEQANVIGTEGSFSPAFFRQFRGIASTHCVIEHDRVGWYVRFFNDKSQYNGSLTDPGDQVLLRNRDIITLGNNCVLEVFLDPGGRG